MRKATQDPDAADEASGLYTVDQYRTEIDRLNRRIASLRNRIRISLSYLEEAQPFTGQLKIATELSEALREV